jgi:iron uptake system component EfeO
MRVVRPSLPALILLAAPILTGCADNGATRGGDDQVIEVDSSADDCTLSRTEVPAGSLTFEVTNTGDDVTEFYLYAEDGERIVSEVENIGPGLSRELVAAVPAGSYVAACKPGMTGDGIRVDLVVTDSGESVEPVADEEVIEQASEGYGEYVREETDELVAATAQFVAAFTAGRDDLARSLYPEARTHWERIEPVAESFGELDPILDAREADLEPGQRWTGWHRLEKDLWPQRAGSDYAPLTPAQRTALAANLTANTAELQEEIAGLTFTVDQIANGSRALMEEVATGKITGEEEYWSRTDLWDFQANVDGAREAFELLEPIVATKDPELEETLDDRFDALQALLDAQRDGDGFVFYHELTRQEVKTLADAVNALSEPLSELTSVVMS